MPLQIQSNYNTAANAVSAVRFQDAIENWHFEELLDALSTLKSKRSAWAKARAEVVREELAARAAFYQ